MGDATVPTLENEGISEAPEKNPPSRHLEEADGAADLVYDNVDEEPEIHMRTWIALAAMLVVNLTQVFAIQGPPAMVSWHPIKQWFD